jgi:hypothetical protein
MYREFLTARSPIRMLEKGLHGGLGTGNLGVVLAGHGVGKSPFLVGLALDSLLRDQNVLHVGLDQTVDHIRTYYDTVFEELVQQSNLEDAATVHAEADRRRSIRVYTSEGFHVGKLREALDLEAELSEKPEVVIVDGAEALAATDVKALRELAAEHALELWLAVAGGEEQVSGLPERLEAAADQVSVVLALEPGADALVLRAIKDHDNPDVSELHVALDPRSLLLIRN